MSLHPSVRCSLDGWIALFVYKHKLGTLEEISPMVIENLFASDLSYLQKFYRYINDLEEDQPDSPTPSPVYDQP